ncbi:hypothetical protein niasHT_000460 [Heterodera trifolii]|uniref:Uncharacterized protein n=1 Tax=Heterodera trifolii TaxID=157864 RepID=A0ABD2M2Z0_9BILA
MSINLRDKKSLMENILPTVDISHTINGITVSSERIAVARTIPFDIVGKCKECKATDPRSVPFDVIYELPGYTFFKIRNKGRVFNVEFLWTYFSGNHGNCHFRRTMGMSNEQSKQQPPIDKQKEQTDEEILDEFLESVSAATTYLDVSQKKKPKKKGKKEAEDEEAAAIASISRKQ